MWGWVDNRTFSPWNKGVPGYSSAMSSILIGHMVTELISTNE